MLLAEAIQERRFLKQLLGVLSSRVSNDNASKRVVEGLVTEIASTANRLRDLEVAIGWTEQQASISGLPLAAYRIRGCSFNSLADVYESVDAELSDKYRRQAHVDESLAEKVVWLIDLQVPPVETTDAPEEEE